MIYLESNLNKYLEGFKYLHLDSSDLLCLEIAFAVPSSYRGVGWGDCRTFNMPSIILPGLVV